MHVRSLFTPAAPFANGFLIAPRPFSSYEILLPAYHVAAKQKRNPQMMHQWTRFRHHASIAVEGSFNEKTNSVGPLVELNKKPQETTRKISPEAAAGLFDPYLPLELRSKSWLENLAAFEGIRAIDSLPQALREARLTSISPRATLSYIALDQDRWAAWLFLIKEFLKCNVRAHLKVADGLSPGLLGYGTGPLDDLSLKPFTAQLPAAAICDRMVSLDEMTEHYETGRSGAAHGAIREAIGQMWQSIAISILEATEREPDQRTEMMSYVHQAIAQLHHHGWVPHSIYTSKSGKVAPNLKKPPLLELLSWRIMTALSDSEWKAREREFLVLNTSGDLEFASRGNELPGGEYQPRIRALGTATWLEFVLWACVESNMIHDAWKIVFEIATRKGEYKWRVANWEALQASALSKRAEAAKVKPGLIQWWLNNLRGTAEGYNEDLPLLEMGQRTVSSEVVATIADGLVSSTRADASGFALKYCKTLLDRQEQPVDPNFWDSILLRLVQTRHYARASVSGIVHPILDLSRREQHGGEGMDHRDGSGHTVPYSSATLGLLIQALNTFCSVGDVSAAMVTFKKLQDWITHNRKVAQGTTSHRHLPEANEGSNPPDLQHKLSQSTLAAFLDLLIDTKEYEFSKQLLYSDGVNGPVIASSLQGSAILQPALLRFAVAISDYKLVKAVTDRMTTSEEFLSEESLKALLHCQMRLGKWSLVEDLLWHVTRERNFQVKAYDVMVLSETVIRLQLAVSAGESTEASLNEAQGVLKHVLTCTYRPAPDPRQPRDFSQLRLLSQCRRILASIPELRGLVTPLSPMTTGQASAPVPISPRAFNILIDAIVEAYGSERGKELFEAWCQVEMKEDAAIGDSEVLGTSLVAEEHRSSHERVVIPNLQTVRIILQPILRVPQATIELCDNEPPKSLNGAKRSGAEEVHTTVAENENVANNRPDSYEAGSAIVQPIKSSGDMLLDWGTTIYRQMGLSDTKISAIMRSKRRERLTTAVSPKSQSKRKYLQHQVSRPQQHPPERKTYSQSQLNELCLRKLPPF